MLQTIREYACEQLAASRELEAMRDRHARYFLSLVEQAEPRIRSAERGRWLTWLDAEYDNIRTALTWSVTADPELALRLAGALTWFWYFRGYVSEGQQQCEAVLRALPPGSPLWHSVARAKALFGAGGLAWVQNHLPVAQARLQTSTALFREASDWPGLAYALYFLSRVARFQPDQTASHSLQEESVSLFRQIGDRWGLALALGGFGHVARQRRNYGAARAALEESLAIWRELGDTWGQGLALLNLGMMASRQGDYELARPRLEESLLIFGRVGDRWFMAQCLAGLAGIARFQGQPEQAARLLGAAQAQFDALGASLDPADRLEYDRHVAAVRAKLNQAIFAACWAEGQRLALEQAVALALERAALPQPDPEPAPPSSAAKPGPLAPGDLTGRELQVVRLVATGLTDVQVAEKLGLSPRTIHRHLSSVYAKLGLNSRHALTRYVIEEGVI